MICAIEGCGKATRNRTLCEMHYFRLRRYGDVNFRQRRANGESGKKPTRYKVWLQDGRRVQAAVVVAEKALGKRLPKGVLVHHVNGDSFDDRNSNLLVCRRGLHNIIHGRMKALDATGNARAKPCRFCHKYEMPGILKENGTSHFHQSCANRDAQKRRGSYESLQSGCL